MVNVSNSSPFMYQRAPIILLKEGTDSSQGRPQIISNINACEVVVDAIGSTLGPRGMDKLIVDGHGMQSGTVSYTLTISLEVGKVT